MTVITLDDTYKNTLHELEGFSETPYKDVTGETTIGYGQTNFDPSIKKVDKNQAAIMRDNSLAIASKEAGDRITRPLSPTQQYAMGDITYNVGTTKLVKQKFFEKINTGTDDEIKALLLSYTKARDPKTGQLRDYPGLVKRAQQRAEWWGVSPEQGAPTQIQTEDLASQIDEEAVTSFADEPKTVPQVSYMDSLVSRESGVQKGEVESDEEREVTPQSGPDEDVQRYDFGSLVESSNSGQPSYGEDRGGLLSLAGELSDDQAAEVQESAIRLSKELGIPQQIAEIKLQDDSYENLVVQSRAKEISTRFPTVNRWASDPKNFPLLKSDPDFVMDVERNAWNFFDQDSTLGDVEQALATTTVQMQNATTMFKGFAGFMTKKEMEQALLASEKITLSKPRYKYQNQIDNFNLAAKESEKGFEKSFEVYSKAYNTVSEYFDGDFHSSMPTIQEMYAAKELTFNSLMGILEAAINNPKGATIMSSESVGTALSGAAGGIAGQAIGFGLGAIAGAVGTPIPGAAVYGGYLGSFASGAAVLYSQYIMEEFDKYRRDDGTTDFGALLYNKKEWDKVHKAALMYAGVGGIIESLSWGMLTKIGIGPKEATKFATTGVADKAASTAARIAGSGSAQVAGEAFQEGAATTAAEFYREGEITVRKAAEIAVKSATEGTLMVPTGAAMGTAAVTLSRTISKLKEHAARRKAAKFVRTGKDAKKGLENFEKISRLRELFKKSKGAKTHKSKSEDLLKKTLRTQKKNEEAIRNEKIDESFDETDIQNVSPDQMQSELNAATRSQDDYVSINIKMYEAIVEAAGQDITAEQLAKNLGEEAHSSYLNARDNGGSFEVALDKWFTETESFEVLDEVVRLNDHSHNAIEGKITLDAMSADPFSWLGESEVEVIKDKETGEVTEIKPLEIKKTEEEGKGELEAGDPTVVTQVQQEPSPPKLAGDPTLRSLKLFDRFRNNEERKVYKNLKTQLRKTVKNMKNVTESEADVVSDIQFRHLRNRARITGRSLTDLYKETSIRAKTLIETTEKGSEGRLGFFQPTPGRDTAWYIALRKDAKVNAIVHEIGHSWIYEMGQDWQFIHDLDPEKLTFAQAEYKFAMDHLAKEFGLDDLKKMSDYSPENEAFADKRTEFHERFAQTTEKYFMDGKFRDSTMRRVLETFRKYFTRIASEVGTAYKQYPALKISPKVERVFTALIGVNQKELEILSPMFPDPAFDTEFLGATSKEYLEQLKNAEDHAAAQFYLKAFNTTWRKNEKLRIKLENAAYDQATEKIDKMESMLIFRDFDTSYKTFKASKDLLKQNEILSAFEKVELEERAKGPISKEQKEAFDQNKREREILDQKIQQVGVIESDPRISYESFLNLLKGNEKLAAQMKKLIPQAMIAGKKKGGVAIEEVMLAYRIGDPRRMVEILLEAGKRVDLIVEEADKLIDKVQPLIKSDEQLHIVAEQAVNGTPKASLVRKQMEFMATKALSQLKGLTKTIALTPTHIKNKMNKEFVEAEATAILTSRKVKGFSPSKILRESDRFGKLAAEFFSKGDFIEAFEAKTKQAIWFEAYRKAETVGKIIGKSVATMKRVMKTSDNKLGKTYDIDVIGYTREVIATFSAQSKRFPMFNPENYINAQNITTAQVTYINAKISDFVRSMEGKTMVDMDVESYLHLTSALRVLVSVARGARTLEMEGRTVRVADTAIEGVKQFGKKRKGSATRSKNLALRDVTTPLTVLSQIFDTDEDFANSVAGKLYESVTAASTKLRQEFGAGKELIDRAIRKAVRKEKGLKKIYAPMIRALPSRYMQEYGKKPINAPLLNVTFRDKSEFLMLMLYMGSKSGAEKALMGGYEDQKMSEWNFDRGTVNEDGFWQTLEDFIDEGIITKSDLDVLQVIWDQFSKHHEGAKRAMRYVDGHAMGTIKARPFKTKLGTFTGGYIPAAGDQNFIGVGHHSELFNIDGDNLNHRNFYPDQNTGFTNQRNTKWYPMSFDLGSVGFQLYNHMKIAYLRKPMYDAGKVLDHPVFKAGMEHHVPGSVKDTLVPWYDSTLSQQITPPSDDLIPIIMRTLKERFYTKVFLGSWTAPLKQLSGWSPAARKVGKRRLAKHIAANSGLKALPAAKSFVLSKSEKMASRFKNHARNLVDNMEFLDANNGWVSAGQRYSKELAMLPMQAMQTMVDISIWTAAYDQAINSKGLDEQAAIRYSDNVVDTTQSATDVATLSRLFKGPESQRIFTMLLSVPAAMFNEMYVAHARSTDKASFEKAKIMMNVIVMTSILPGLFAASILQFKASFDDDDEDNQDDEMTIEESMALSTALETLENTIPFVGRVASNIIQNEATGQRREYSPSPAFSVTKDLLSTSSAVRHMQDDVNLSTYEFSGMMNLFTIMTGLGFSVLGSIVKYVEAWESPSEKREKKRIRREQISNARERKAL